MYSIGKTYEDGTCGRLRSPISPGRPREETGMYIDGNHHAGEVTGSAVCLYRFGTSFKLREGHVRNPRWMTGLGTYFPGYPLTAQRFSTHSNVPSFQHQEYPPGTTTMANPEDIVETVDPPDEGARPDGEWKVSLRMNV